MRYEGFFDLNGKVLVIMCGFGGAGGESVKGSILAETIVTAADNGMKKSGLYLVQGG